MLAVRRRAAVAAEHQLAAAAQAGLAGIDHADHRRRQLAGDPPLELGGLVHHGGEAGDFVHGGVLVEVLDASEATSGWLWSADGTNWQTATGVQALMSSPGVRQPIPGLSPVTLTSNGERFLAAIYKEKGPWTMAISKDGVTWTALAGQTASPGVLDPRLMPHGVFLQFRWFCADGRDYGYCSSPPPGGAEYGAAR